MRLDRTTLVFLVGLVWVASSGPITFFINPISVFTAIAGCFMVYNSYHTLKQNEEKKILARKQQLEELKKQMSKQLSKLEQIQSMQMIGYKVVRSDIQMLMQSNDENTRKINSILNKIQELEGKPISSQAATNSQSYNSQFRSNPNPQYASNPYASSFKSSEYNKYF